jgi:hypothetical protein
MWFKFVKLNLNHEYGQMERKKNGESLPIYVSLQILVN